MKDDGAGYPSVPGGVSPPASDVLDYGVRERRGRWGRLLRPWLLLCLILLLAAALRWLYIGHDSFWLDEFLAVENSTGRGQLHVKLPRNVVIDPGPALTRLSDGPGFLRIWTSLDTETHPPLYFMALNLWRHAFGEQDVAARAFSAAASLLGIVLLYHTAKLLHGPAPALWACLIAAVAAPQIRFSQTARNYTLLLALVLAAALALTRIEKLGVSRWRLLGLTAATLAAMLTHYLAFGAIGALALYAVVRLRGRARRAALGSFAAAAVLFAAVWGPFFLEQAKRFGGEHAWMLESEATGNTMRAAGRLVGLPIQFFLRPMKNSQAVANMACVLFVVPMLMLRARRDLLLWCILLLAPVAQVLVSDVARGAYALGVVRYTFLATAPAYVLVAAMLSHKAGFLRHAVPLTVAVSCLGALQSTYARQQPDWRESADVLRENCGPGDLVVFIKRDDRDWRGGAYYMAMSHYAPTGAAMVFVSGPPGPELEPRLRAARSVWVATMDEDFRCESLFPGGRVTGGRAFPLTGTVARIELPQRLANVPTTRSVN